MLFLVGATRQLPHSLVQRVISILFLLSYLLMSSGCGSSREFVVSGTGDEAQGTAFSGKLFLGSSIEGVRVELQSLEGAVLDTQTSDASGNFLFRGAYPARFRLVATLSDGLQFAREVQGNANGSFVVINVPTTLVSLLSQAQPGSPLPEIERAVADTLGLPEGSGLELIEDSVGFRFSHLAFFVRASEAGGVRALFEQLAAGGAGGGRQFLLRQEALDGALAGLPPELTVKLEALQDNPRVRMSVRMLLARGLDEAEVSIPQGINAQVGEIAGALLAGIGINIAADVVADVGDVGYTWVAQQLGWHYGSTTEMNEILKAINGVAAGIQSIGNQQTADEIQDGVDAMNPAVTRISADTNSQVAAINAALAQTDGNGHNSYFTQGPSTSTLPQDIVDYLGVMQTSQAVADYQGYLTLIAQWMTGASKLPIGNNPPVVVESNYDSDMNLIHLSRLSVLQEQNGIYLDDSTQVYMNFPVRTSNFIDQVLQPWQSYAVYQIYAANQLGEAAHSSPSLASSIVSAQVSVDNVARSLQSQRGQVPAYPPSDDVFIDLQYGLVWYMPAQAAKSYGDAGSFAENFKPTLSNGYQWGNWRLPTYNEAKALQQRAIYADAAANGSVDYGNATRGLQRLGFDTTGINSDGEFWVADWQLSGGSWYANRGTLMFRMNHETNNALYNRTDDLPFFIVHTLGTKPLIKIDPPVSITGPADTWPDPLYRPYYLDWEEPFMATFLGFENVLVSGSEVKYSSEWEFYNGNSPTFRMGTSTVNAMSGAVDLNDNESFLSPVYHPPVYFNQDDSTRVSVSNYQGSQGRITSKLGATVSTTIRLYALGYANGVFPSNIEGSVASPISSPQVKMTSLLITPQNLVMSVETTPQASQQFVATGFFSDGSVQDLTTQVTWTVAGVDDGAEFAAGDAGLLKLTKANLPSQPTANLTVTASINQAGNPTKAGSNQAVVLVQIK